MYTSTQYAVLYVGTDVHMGITVVWWLNVQYSLEQIMCFVHATMLTVCYKGVCGLGKHCTFQRLCALYR